MSGAQPTSPFASTTRWYVNAQADLAKKYASLVGTSSYAVAGAVANEFDVRYNIFLIYLPTGGPAQALGDAIASKDIRMLFGSWLGKANYSHDFYENNYKAVLSGNPNSGYGSSTIQKINNPTMLDIGPGNIKISTAIELVEEAYKNFQSTGIDKLNLAKYHGHYDDLVTDLLNFSNPQVSYALTAAVIKKGEQYLSSKAPSAWNALSPDEKDAMLVTYYKMGEATIDEIISKNMSEAAAAGRPYKYNPTGDGGGQHLNNISVIKMIDNPKVFLKCFCSNTPIETGGGIQKKISEIRIGDTVLAFDGEIDCGRGNLVERKVSNIFYNETDQWLILSVSDTGGSLISKLTVTPGHYFLCESGNFEKIEDILQRGDNIVLADGSIGSVEGERIICTEENYDLYEYVVSESSVVKKDESSTQRYLAQFSRLS